jgi:hypothetical protein
MEALQRERQRLLALKERKEIEEEIAKLQQHVGQE